MGLLETLQQLQGDAFDDAPYGEIELEWGAYNNTAYTPATSVGRLYSHASESLYPKLTEAINKLKPRLEEATPRIQIVQNPESRHGENGNLDIEAKQAAIESLQKRFDLIGEPTLDNEGEKISQAVHHVCVGGTAIRKTMYNPVVRRIQSLIVNPLQFAVDPQCHQISLGDARYVVQRNSIDRWSLKQDYPDYRRRRQPNGEFAFDYDVSEFWIRGYFAKSIGIRSKNTKSDVNEVIKDTDIVLATIIDDRIARVQKSPWIYPDFPYSCWRNFLRVSNDGKPSSFWGFGFPRFTWPAQKLLDSVLADFVLIANNLAVGRFLSRKGALDTEQVLPIHGLNIEIEEGFNLADVAHLAPDQMPPTFLQLIQFMNDVIEAMTGATPVFSGEAPFEGASGRAVAALQSAAFTMLASLVRGLTDFRVRTARQIISLVQQFPEADFTPHLWRSGYDLGDLSEEAQYIGYDLEVPDAATLPQTPAGRLQLVQFLSGLGLQFNPEKLLQFTGLDKGYGLSLESFVQSIDPSQLAALNSLQNIPQDQNISPNEEILLGRDGNN